MVQTAIFVAVIALCLFGMGIVFAGNAGPDPAKWLLHQSGFFALVFLVATIAVSPVSRVLARPAIIVCRRPLGLSAFFLATSHVVVYVVLYQAFLWTAIFEDIAKRPYILIGFLSWALLVPLAATSSRRARRRLGNVWKNLHKLVYVIVPIAILHQGMAQKADMDQTLVFVILAGCFLIERAMRAIR